MQEPKQQFVNSINNDNMMTEIIREPTTVTKHWNHQWAGINLGQESQVTKGTQSDYKKPQKIIKDLMPEKAWPKEQYTWQNKV